MRMIRRLITVLVVILMFSALLLRAQPAIEFVSELEIEKSANESWIGLIADTHIPTRAKAIPPKVIKVFEKADLIIHAGDFVELGVVEGLQKLAPVIAVRGNMDLSEIRERLPD